MTAEEERLWRYWANRVVEALQGSHGDAIISGVTEEKPDSRPKCGWPVTEKLSTGGTTTKPCGSEESLYHIKAKGKYTGRDRETDICQKHVPEAWGKWNVTSGDKR